MNTAIRICPYCNDDNKTFKSNQKVRIHVYTQHNVLLPSNDRGKPMIPANAKTKLYLCACCTKVHESKHELRQHVDNEHSFKFTTTFPDFPGWTLQGTDLAERFREYFTHCLENCNRYFDVDQYFNQLLCISHVLVLQKRSQYESMPVEYFPPSLLKAAHQDIISSLTYPVSMDNNIYISIKNIIHDYHDNRMDNLAARHALLGLAMTCKNEAERNVILTVEALLPPIKDLDIGLVGESELIASFIHPMIQALLSYENDDKVARCSNTIPDNGTDITKRPDYEVVMFEQYKESYRTCYGEVKNGCSSEINSILDFYRLCIFCKLEMVVSNLTGILCFQAIGPSITFYYMVHTSATIYALVELGTVEIPTMKKDVMKIIIALDELLKVATIHRSIKKKKSSEMNTSHPTLPFEFVQGKKKTLPAKRKPSLSSISGR
ncbi:hypothetical protein INT45_001300 [Circinella minor]|uniref:C2H2-type domain-containing protein n=1 Tax=Circinella minor TaxID=1195481 RepID=A0A8H7VMB2_9FUNG|nr:hypothetical protein INT45_001300 [Circinella minor]